MVEVRQDPEHSDRFFVTAPELDAEFEIYGYCPVQAFGTVLGRDLYFRARHNAWSFDIADSNGNLPSDGYGDRDGYYREGQYPNASWMPLRDGIKLVLQCLHEFTGVSG